MPIVNIVLTFINVVILNYCSVTAVGGTNHIPETAVSRFFSGGGFSNYVRIVVLCMDSININILYKN